MDIKEILVLHHSHLDVGYTHSQPIVWQLQYEFIEQALDLLDKTEDWDELSKPRWTCEVTAQVIKWLENAGKSQIEKFKNYIAENRIGISGLEYNTTPNSNSEQFTLQLFNSLLLKEKFNTEIKTVHQHDVNGIPWGAADIMIDAGIELFIMATNNHFGGYTYKRPSVFRWQTPSKRELLVMNGAHYTMFDQLMDTPSENLEIMEKGYNIYLQYLKKKNYTLDFIYLTTANAPVCYDNAPPNFEVARLIQKWNEKKKHPPIRYITPNMLLDRIKQIDTENLELVSGDWTDYWNYGCSSTAYETKINQNSKSLLYTAELLSTQDRDNRYRKKNVLNRARNNINTYDEHTWGAFNSVEFDNEFVRSQSHMKKQLAYEGREITEYYLINELENLAANPESNYDQEGVLVVNASPVKRKCYIPVPDWWKLQGKRLRTARFGWPMRYQQLQYAPLYGPVEVEPLSWQKIPFERLKAAQKNAHVTFGDNEETMVIQRLNRPEGDTETMGNSFIESPFHRLEYNKRTGRILSLHDKLLNWEIIDQNSEYTFFQYVREYPDPLLEKERSSLYARDLAREKYDENCWVTDWKAIRETALGCKEAQVDHLPQGVCLKLKFKVNGAKYLEQRITLQGDSPLIHLDASIHKEDIRDPESIYFTFPLNLAPDWQGKFDTCGVHVALDEEQLPRCSKGWQTVESYASIHTENRGVALFCPDAPMVQMGDFNFGRKYESIKRIKSPLLLAWPLNNYWDTNFSSSQPGLINLSYAFSSFKTYDKTKLYNQGREMAVPVEIHPAMNCPGHEQGRFVEIDDDHVQMLYLKRSQDGKGILLRLIKTEHNELNTAIKFPFNIKRVYVADAFEQFVEEIDCRGGEAELSLVPNRITQLIIIPETSGE